MLPDVLALLDSPLQVMGDGYDSAGRERWMIAGATHDGARMDVVCCLETDETGHSTLFITVYWS